MARCCAAVGAGVLLGLAIAIVAPWLLFNLRDTNLMGVQR